MRVSLLLLLSVPLGALAVACGGGGSSTQSQTCSTSAGLEAPLVCASGQVVQGIDVSVYQGSVNWASVKKAGIDFAFARVSDGTGTKDTEFATNWPAMKAAGVIRGAYQFWEPAQDPTAQANLFVQMLQSAGGLQKGDLPPVMDLEVTGSQSDATIQANMKTWIAAMEKALGVTPIIYTSTSFGAHAGTGFSKDPLWVANWGVSCPSLPAGWSTWTFWQKSDSGSVSGISGAVDLDEFNGSLAQLQTFAGGVGGGAPDAGSGSSGSSGSSSSSSGSSSGSSGSGSSSGGSGSGSSSGSSSSGAGTPDAGQSMGTGGDAGSFGGAAGSAGPCGV